MDLLVYKVIWGEASDATYVIESVAGDEDGLSVYEMTTNSKYASLLLTLGWQPPDTYNRRETRTSPNRDVGRNDKRDFDFSGI